MKREPHSPQTSNPERSDFARRPAVDAFAPVGSLDREDVARQSCPVLCADGRALQGSGENLGKHVTNSEHSTAEREQVRAMLGGHGIVFSRDGHVGARFDWAGLAQIDKTLTNQQVRIGSGGLLSAHIPLIRQA